MSQKSIESLAVLIQAAHSSQASLSHSQEDTDSINAAIEHALQMIDNMQAENLDPNIPQSPKTRR